VKTEEERERNNRIRQTEEKKRISTEALDGTKTMSVNSDPSETDSTY
jgi:hypothetical protein